VIDAPRTPQVLVSPEVHGIAERIRSAWKTWRPITGSLWDDVSLHAAEDLSDRALGEWIQVLRSLDQEVGNIRTRTSTLVEASLARELHRFIQEQRYQAEVIRPFTSTLSAYLQLIGLGLYPFTLVAPTSAVIEALRQRLEAAIGWLDEATRRQADGLLIVTQFEAQQAAILADGIDALLRAEQFKRLHARSATLCEQLRRWSPSGAQLQDLLQRQLRQRAHMQPDDIEHLLLNCFGTDKSLSWWQEACADRLHAEIDRLNTAEVRWGSLAEATNDCGWDHGAWGMSDQELHAQGASQAHDVLAWAQHVYHTLQKTVAGSYLSKTAPDAAIEFAPPVAEILVSPALFLRTPTRAADHRLVLSSLLQRTPQPWTRRVRTHMTLTIAHELCPGHHEHIWRRGGGALAPYIGFVQNSIGLEGWAVYAERVVITCDPSLSPMYHYGTIRRLLPSTLLLTKLAKGADVAQQLLEDSIRRCPAIVPHAGRPGQLSGTSLSYTVGLIETERALAAFHQRTHAHLSQDRLVESYLQQGPITPASAVELALAALEIESAHEDLSHA
jgi:hypothetical protein